MNLMYGDKQVKGSYLIQGQYFFDLVEVLSSTMRDIAFYSEGIQQSLAVPVSCLEE